MSQSRQVVALLASLRVLHCMHVTEVSILKMWEPQKIHMESQHVISTMML